MKKNTILITIGIVLLLCIFLVVVLTNKNSIPLDNNGFTTTSTDFEVYSDVYLSDNVKIPNGKVLENKKIDTSDIGKYNLEFIYVNSNGKKRRGIINYNVVDTTKPIILLSNAYSLYVSDDKDLTQSILSADNYDKNPLREIIGDYDINTPGSYSLIYKVTDSSGNIESVPFTLYIKEKPSNSSNNYEKSHTDFSDIYSLYKTDSTKIGIDVSKWQGEIDFTKVKNAGAEFVIIRIGTGLGFKKEYVIDKYFKQNIENARKAGLKVGVYYYSYATTKDEAKSEAKWVIETLGGTSLDLPIAFDWESFSYFNGLGMSLYDLNSVASAFKSIIEKHGYKYILYGSKYYLNNIWNEDAPVWLAHYTSKTNYEGKYMLWQLCEDGKIDGINGDVDIDILYE